MIKAVKKPAGKTAKKRPRQRQVALVMLGSVARHGRIGTFQNQLKGLLLTQHVEEISGIAKVIAEMARLELVERGHSKTAPWAAARGRRGPVWEYTPLEGSNVVRLRRRDSRSRGCGEGPAAA